MEYRVNLTARAVQDLGNIYQYIQAEHSGQAAIWFNGLHEAMQSLKSLPYRFAVIPENSALRHLLYGPKSHVYRVIYSINDSKQTETILTIRHGAHKPL